MKLNANGLSDRKQWEEKGYALPQFDREAVTAATGNLLEVIGVNQTLQSLIMDGIFAGVGSVLSFLPPT